MTPATVDTTSGFDHRERMIRLSREDCLQQLGRCGVGRVGMSVGALPAIFPVNYAMLDEDVVFRTGTGTKLDAALVSSVVAFEVDEADPLFHSGWSVLVIGIASVIDDPSTATVAARLPLAPWAGGSRDRFVRISTKVISGRQILDDTGAG